MNKKGFTLLELMAVVILMLIIMTLAAPSLITISKDRKVQVYESKISKIESNAIVWGQENFQLLSGDCTCIKVQTLLDSGHISADDNDKNVIYNPVTNEKMNNYNICVKYDFRTDRIYADMYKPDESQGECR